MTDKYGSFENPSEDQSTIRYRVETSFSSGNTDNKHVILNAICVILLFLSWVACCVVFGAPLHTIDGTLKQQGANADGTLMFYWNRYSASFNGFSDSFDYGDCSNCCKSGGQGLVALGTFAFLSLILSLIFVICRMSGRTHLLPFKKLADNPIKYLEVEMANIAWIAFLFFLMSVTWGGCCYQDSGNCDLIRSILDINSPRATGYAFICSCLFFLLITLGILYHLRQVELFGTVGSSLLPSSYPPSAAAYPSSSSTFPSAAISSETIPATSSNDSNSST